MSLYVGVDIGGTTSTIAIGDANRHVVCVSEQFPTYSEVGPARSVDAIAEQVERALEEHRLSLAEVAGAAIATPGPATLDGVLQSSPNLASADWDGCNIRELLQRRLREKQPDIQVRYIGDGQAAAFGEYSLRRGSLTWPGVEVDTDRTLDSLFMVTVGTGFGGGEVREGQVVRGNQGRAGHAGHIMLPHGAFRYDHDRQLKVGNAYSTVESAISLTALTHQLGYRLSLPQWREHPLRNASGTDKDKAKRLRELAAKADPLSLELFDDQAAALGIALLCLNYLGDYDLLVIGGGVCDLTESLRGDYLKSVVRSYQQHALNGFRYAPPIEFSTCGDQASVIGALVFASQSG